MSAAYFLQYLEAKTSSDLTSYLERLDGREVGRGSLEVEEGLEEEGGLEEREGGRGTVEVEEKGGLVWRVITTVAGRTQEELYQVPIVP